MPTALGRHLEKLSEASPGQRRHGREGPGSADEAKFAALAYPAADVSAGEGSGAAASRRRRASSRRARAAKGSWVSVGPSNALYPRRRSATRSATCRPSTSRPAARPSLAIADLQAGQLPALDLAVAGGGVWRTKNALTGKPNWEFLSGSFGIQSIGSITIDPNDPSGNTLYVGTGEANASGGSAARASASTSRPTAATPGPARSARQVQPPRRSGPIAVKPGDPNTIYVGTTRAVRGVSSVTGGGVSGHPGAPQWGLYKSTNGGASWTFIHNGARDAGAVCTGTRDRSATGHRARRAASAAWSSTRPTRTSSTRRRMRAASGARPTAARRGRRSSRR